MTHSVLPSKTSNMANSSPNQSRYLFWSVFAVLCVIWLVVVSFCVINIPYNDDYPVILGGLIDLTQAQGLSGRIDVLFSQYSENRIAVVRMIVLACYKICGQVRFDYLALAGNVFLALIAWSLIRISGASFRWHTIPILFFLLNLQNWANSTWAYASVANYGYLFFSITAIYFASLPGALALVFSMLCCVIGVFTQAGTLPALAVILAMLLYRRRYVYFAVFLAFSAVLTLSYFYGYKSPEYHPDILLGLIFVEKLVPFLTLFIGNSLEVGGRLGPAALGAATLAFFAYLTFVRRLYRDNLALYGVWLYMLALATLVSAGREELGLDISLSARYRIYSLIFVCLGYLSILQMVSRRGKRSFAVAWIVVAVAWSAIFSAVGYPAMRAKQSEYRHLYEQMMYHGAKIIYRPYKGADELLKKAVSMGIYVPEREKE